MSAGSNVTAGNPSKKRKTMEDSEIPVQSLPQGRRYDRLLIFNLDADPRAKLYQPLIVVRNEMV